MQLDTDYVRTLAGKKVGEALQARDERGCWEKTADELNLTHLIDREVTALSGGALHSMLSHFLAFAMYLFGVSLCMRNRYCSIRWWFTCPSKWESSCAFLIRFFLNSPLAAPLQ